MTTPWIERFREIISRHTGLVVPERETSTLEKILAERCKLLNFPRPEPFFQLLEEESEEARTEWRQLILALTTGESYFFRDSGQFSLLEDVLLPELLERNNESRRLRLWSAGCSTGEEPYTLAMILDRLLPDQSAWDIQILGSDINERSLEVAREGRYGQWSFRRMEVENINNYFNRKKGHGFSREVEWQLDKRIRHAVTFRRLNLIKDPFPEAASGLEAMDLILCRNVFIYFTQETVAMVVGKLIHSLAPGGYLLTGHTELSGIPLTGVTTKIFPESMVYQRRRPEELTPVRPSLMGGRESGDKMGKRITPALNAATTLAGLPHFRSASRESGGSVPLSAMVGGKAPPLSSPAGGPSSLPLSSSVAGNKAPPLSAFRQVRQGREQLKEVEALFARGEYAEVVARSKQIVAQSAASARMEGGASLDGTQLKGSMGYGLFLLAARAAANMGDLSQAERYCQQAMQSNGLSAAPYLVMAHICHERGAVALAKEHLKRAIYLAPLYAPPYLELGVIYQHEGDHKRMRTMLRTALDLLRSLPPDSRIESYEEWRVAELLQQVRLLLGEREGNGDA